MLFLQNQVILGLSPLDLSLLFGAFYFIACLSIGLVALDPGELIVISPVVAVLAFLIWPAIILAVAVLIFCLAVMLIWWVIKAIVTPSESPPVAQ